MNIEIQRLLCFYATAFAYRRNHDIHSEFSFLMYLILQQINTRNNNPEKIKYESNFEIKARKRNLDDGGSNSDGGAK